MKATVLSGNMYTATWKANNERVGFFVSDEGEIYLKLNDCNPRLTKPEIAMLTDISYDCVNVCAWVDGNGEYQIYNEQMYKYDDELYTLDEAIDRISDDDDAFREYVDNNAGYIYICGHNYYTDYDTISDWGIIDDIREDFNNDMESMLKDNDIDGWESMGDFFREKKFYILDDGTVIGDVSEEMLKDLIDIYFTVYECNDIGDWRFTKVPKDSSGSITVNPDSERPISLS